MLLNWIFPIDRNMVVVVSNYGAGFGDNGKAISISLLKKRPGIKIIWAVKNGNEKSIPREMYSVRFRSLKYYSLMARAGTWIDNSRKSRDLVKRKGQTYMQTWHGGIALKRIEKDAESSLASNYIKEAKNDSVMADIFLSNSNFCTKMYRRAFWYDGEILMCGSPRIDTLLNAHEESRTLIKKNLGVSFDSKLVLYAPTFRADYNTDCYNIDYSRLLGNLGDDWVIAIRLHPNMDEKSIAMEFNSRIISVTRYADLYELLSVTDMVITDYSSIMFEAAIAKKRVVLFASDIEKYVKDRNFYFNLNELPFPIARTNEELADIIGRFDEKGYEDSVDVFNKKLGLYEHGDASERAADRILSSIDARKE